MIYDSSIELKKPYHKKGGWATMPYEKEPDSSVAEKCAEQILKIG